MLQKIAMRAKKFGVVSSEEAKKAIRAQRFVLFRPVQLLSGGGGGGRAKGGCNRLTINGQLASVLIQC